MTTSTQGTGPPIVPGRWFSLHFLSSASALPYAGVSKGGDTVSQPYANVHKGWGKHPTTML